MPEGLPEPLTFIVVGPAGGEQRGGRDPHGHARPRAHGASGFTRGTAETQTFNMLVELPMHSWVIMSYSTRATTYGI